MAAKKKGAGGTLSRSEVVTIRLDPKLRFAAELAARKQRRTLSSFIEWAVEQAANTVEMYTWHDKEQNNPVVNTAMDVTRSIWDVEESTRLIRLALSPWLRHLLSFREDCLWKLITDNAYFWRVKVEANGEKTWSKYSSEQVIVQRVREQWKTLNSVVDGEIGEQAIPTEPIIERIEAPEDQLPF